MKTVTEQFTYPLLKEADQCLPRSVLLQLCPKTSFALIGTELAKWIDIAFPQEEMSYGLACGELVGKNRFAGQTCIKNIGYKVNGTIKALELIESD